MKNRQILNEVLISRKRLRGAWVIFKIDLEKAYCHVEWSFIMYMTRRFDFGDTWCMWIEECISFTSLSILVNGLPSKLFKASRGIRHGPPPPFLFTMVAETLSSLISKKASLMALK